MSAGYLDERLAKKLAGQCLYSSCREAAEPGSAWCGPHGERERSQGAARQAVRREKLRAEKRCLDCGVSVASVGLRRCAKCRQANLENRPSVTGSDASVTVSSADDAFERTARTKLEKAYDKLVDGSERFIERTVFRSRGGQTRESMDADDAADVRDAVRLLAGHEDRLAKLHATEGELGRIARAEARAAVADPLLRAARLIAGVAAALYPDGWKLVREGLGVVDKRER